MTTENQKRAALLIGGGIAGFLLGWFLKKPKAGITLEQLLIDPPVASPGAEVIISCIATNRLKEAGTFTIWATIGNEVLQQDIYLEPEIPTEVTFHYNLPAQVTNYYVTVSVGDLVGVFLVSEGEVF